MKKVLYLGSIIFVLAILLIACGQQEPANHLEAIQQAGKMVVATSADFPPYEFVDDDGNITGFDIVFIEEIGSRMGLEVEVMDMPFDSLLAAVQEGQRHQRRSPGPRRYQSLHRQRRSFSGPFVIASAPRGSLRCLHPGLLLPCRLLMRFFDSLISKKLCTLLSPRGAASRNQADIKKKFCFGDEPRSEKYYVTPLSLPSPCH